MTKTSRKVIILMIMLVIVSLYFVSGTYARYTSSVTGNAAVSTANWAVAFNGGAIKETEEFTLNFTVAENENVVNGKIAPGTTATATIELDLTGTEVAVEYEATIGEDELKAAFGNSANNVTVTVSDNNNSTGVVEINEAGTALETNNVTITITLQWNNTDSTNKSDTEAAGQTNLVLPVTLTVQQHI